MKNEQLTFEQLKEVSTSNIASDILRKVYGFINEVGKIENVSDVGITITYKGIPLYQQESENGLTVWKETRFSQFKPN